VIATLSHGWLVTLYLVGAGLEIVGVSLVFAELVRDKRKAAEIVAWKRPRFGESPLEAVGQHSTMAMIEHQTDPLGYQRRQLGNMRARSQRDAIAAATSVEELRGNAIDALIGNRRLRLLGVALIGLGILVSVLGNIAAL